MKQGDLVNFHTEATVFPPVKEYVNPGIVLDVKQHNDMFKWRRVHVMWADGRLTREHASYLQKVSDENR